MGKKLKSGEGTRPIELANDETSGLMGISKESKKIKKQKTKEHLTKFKIAVHGTEATVEHERKNKKHKLPQENENSIEPQPGYEVNGSNVISKKSKKNKLLLSKVHSDHIMQELETKPQKIKKQKTKEHLTELENAAHGMEATVEHVRKNKKHKLPQENGNSIEPQPGHEVNGSNVISKKSKKNKLPVPKVHSDHIMQELKTEPQRENKQEASVSSTGSDIVSKKTKKKKRKALDVKVDIPKKHKKTADSVQNKSDDKNEDYVEPQVKNKKKKLKNQPNGTKEDSGPALTKPKVNKHMKSIEADKDVVTSESDSEDDQNGASNNVEKHSKANDNDSSGGDQADKKVNDTKKAKHFTGPEHSIFIGNLPNTVKKSTMKSMFKQYGQIQSIRFRSNDGVTLFKKKDRKEAKALICYIRFATRKEAEAACVTNGQLVEGNRIRVTMHMQKQIGHAASTVFVGNISHSTTDNELYDFFSRVGELEYVRQIARKGIGYVCFKKGVSIAKALKLNQQLLNGRPLRIGKVDPTKQEKRKNKKGNLVDKAKSSRPDGADGRPASQQNRQQGDQMVKKTVREFHGALANTKSDKKRKHMKKGGSAQKKKLLGKKLTAVGGSRKQ